MTATPHAERDIALIRQKLIEAFETEQIDITDNTWRHAGHGGNPNSHYHFSITITSPRFNDMVPLARIRAVQEVLTEEMAHKIHALDVRCFPQEKVG